MPILLHAHPAEKSAPVSWQQAYIAYTRLRNGPGEGEAVAWWMFPSHKSTIRGTRPLASITASMRSQGRGSRLRAASVAPTMILRY
jgi:hypothetical protein